MQAQEYTYTTNSLDTNTVTITKYTGLGGSINIPSTIGDKTVTGIRYRTFMNCTNITDITIPDSVTSIGDGICQRCFNLTDIVVDANNTVYCSTNGILFNKEQTTLVQFPVGRTGDYTISNGVIGVGVESFFGCRGLSNIAFPEGLSSIGSGAFFECTSLTNISIPDCVANIGYRALCSGTNLYAITIGISNSVYSSLNGVLFDKTQTMLIQFPGGMTGHYAVPDSVVGIDSNAFYFYCSLNSIVIPDNVVSIGEYAFYYCSSLTNIIIGDGITEIKNGTFSSCSGLSTVTIPAAVTNMAYHAFNKCSSLTGLYFRGDMPSANPLAFLNSEPVVYYLPGSVGWPPVPGPWEYLTTAYWLPKSADDGSLGIETNEFGFNINWAEGQTVVVDACGDLANPVWMPLQTNVLSSDTLYFGDPLTTNHSCRFYRLRSP